VVIDDGLFGLLPHFAKELAYSRKTYNARSETVDKLPSFKEYWAHGRRCIVSAESVYEANYETGQAVRWMIQQPAAVPMGIAGIYRQWRGLDGRFLRTFAMVTVNPEGHPVYQLMHKPGDEKRMVWIFDPADYDRWLQCSPGEPNSFFKQWQGPLDAFPAPLPPRKRKPRWIPDGYCIL
jgi:putative SOS response-associated peptidase YedK